MRESTSGLILEQECVGASVSSAIKTTLATNKHFTHIKEKSTEPHTKFEFHLEGHLKNRTCGQDFWVNHLTTARHV